MHAWACINKQNPETVSKIGNQILWYNSMIKVGHKVYFDKKAYAAGILYVKKIYLHK